jgi:hypothetical protein
MVRKNLLKKNKKGWIKIVEAFVSVLLLMGILLIVIGNENIKKNDGTIVREKENEILNEIAINQTLRSEVLNQQSLPINSNDESFSLILNEYLNNSLSDRMHCLLSICLNGDECLGYINIEENTYVEQSLITTNMNTYSPRILKIFCYVK